MDIGIVGLGIVGNALYELLNYQFSNIKRYDPDKKYKDKINNVDVIFVCINDKSEDMNSIKETVKYIVKENKKAMIVLRTTLVPGTTDALILEHKRIIVYMPEFLREWNIAGDMINPDKIVIGTENNKAFETLIDIFRFNNNIALINDIIQVKPIEAEIAKLALNSLAVIKVVFAEEIYDLAEHFGADYNKIYRIFKADKNVNERHLMANKDGYRGASGKCLPKDIGFLNYTGEKAYTNLLLVKLAEQLNIHYLMMKMTDD